MFHFKKFSIDDSQCAMKIGTDGVLLGAWVTCENETRILDIGTGSGIIALIMAQRNKNTPIDAIESEQAAASQASDNFQLSPWTTWIQIHYKSVQDFSIATQQKYSLIVCNPPFFTNSLKAPGKARNMARHNDTLPVADLLRITSGLLTNQGKAAFIIPADAWENWRSIAAGFSLFPGHITQVKSSAEQSAHRILVTFSLNEIPGIPIDELSIYTARSVYSTEYKELTRDFYLNF